MHGLQSTMDNNAAAGAERKEAGSQIKKCCAPANNVGFSGWGWATAADESETRRSSVGPLCISGRRIDPGFSESIKINVTRLCGIGNRSIFEWIEEGATSAYFERVGAKPGVR